MIENTICTAYHLHIRLSGGKRYIKKILGINPIEYKQTNDYSLSESRIKNLRSTYCICFNFDFYFQFSTHKCSFSTCVMCILQCRSYLLMSASFQFDSLHLTSTHRHVYHAAIIIFNYNSISNENNDYFTSKNKFREINFIDK